MSMFSSVVRPISKSVSKAAPLLGVVVPLSATSPVTAPLLGSGAALSSTVSTLPLISAIPATTSQAADNLVIAGVNKENSVSMEEYNYWAEQEQVFSNLLVELEKQSQTSKYLLFGGGIILLILLLRR